MKISIIIPVYNSADYILDCLLSVTGQTYSGKLECILVDDCGSDNSIEIAHKFIDKYQGAIDFSIVHHKKNRGAAAARNTGLNIASGDYIYFLDSDDWIISTCIDDLVSMLVKYPNVDLVHAGIKTTDGSIPWFDFERNPLIEYIDDFYEIKVNQLGSEKIPASPVNKLLPISFLKQHSIFFHEGIVMEDVLWCNLLAKHVRSIACINKNTYFYRVHENSVVTSGMGVDPKRKLVIYDLMINGIDEPYIKEQIEHITYLLDRLYFDNVTPEIRVEIGKLLHKLSTYSSFYFKIRLHLKSFFAMRNKRNGKLYFYLYSQFSNGDSFLFIIIRIIKRFGRFLLFKKDIENKTI